MIQTGGKWDNGGMILTGKTGQWWNDTDGGEMGQWWNDTDGGKWGNGEIILTGENGAMVE